MLDFFRRHQRYFFVVITIVIVISFSFFGTYSTLSNSSFREQIAFKKVDGTDVTRHELDEMVYFISTDTFDKVLFGGAWGPNFFNDGVIRKDFLETGLGAMLAYSYVGEVERDLAPRLEKEKRFTPYVHPQAKFIGLESAWGLFMPDMKTNYQGLRAASSATSPQALQMRVALYLMERQFPPSFLRQVLHFQERQQNWVTPDQNIDKMDFSLFGYHTIEDWFGPRFLRLVAEFIMNASAIAEQKGYRVEKAEALADLMRNSELSYQQNLRSGNLGVKDSSEYFNEQLRRLGMDQNGAANIWRQVLLFRRLFSDMGSSPFLDTFSFEKYNEYALEMVKGELYRLPKDLRLGSYRAFQKFEVYLDAVSKRSEQEKAKLKLPTTFLSVGEVSKAYPELVVKRYLLEVAQTDKKALEGNVGVKDSWNWEISDSGWDNLKKEFPELGVSSAKTSQERFTVLENLDDKTRARVDAYARAAIVDAHPEWLQKALDEAKSKRMTVALHEKGGSEVFKGLDNGKTLIDLLDKAPLKAEAANAQGKTALKTDAELSHFSADKNHYYRIDVIDRAAAPEVLTFGEAEQEAALDKVLDSKLDAYYQKIRTANPKEFQRDDKSWKPFADVKDQVADKYFEKVLNDIRAAYAAAIAPEAPPAVMINDYVASLRLFPYAREVEEALKKDPSKEAEYVRAQVKPNANKDALPPSSSLVDQWKFDRNNYQTTRSSGDKTLDKQDLFTMSQGGWSKIKPAANGELVFFHLKEKGNQSDQKAVVTSVTKGKKLLSDDAQQNLMNNILQQINAKNAISLDFMNQVAESENDGL